MNDNDMSEMIKKAQYMIQNNQIPDDIKKLINNFQSSNNSNSLDINSKSYNKSNNTYNNTKNNSNYNNYYNQNQSYKNYSKNNSFNSNNNYETNSSKNSSNSSIPDIDMETLMKIQNIMSKMKNNDNDDMSRLLLSLKPYLRDGRKDKIDEYIKLIKMGKMTQFMNSFGGDKK